VPPAYCLSLNSTRRGLANKEKKIMVDADADGNPPLPIPTFPPHYSTQHSQTRVGYNHNSKNYTGTKGTNLLAKATPQTEKIMTPFFAKTDLKFWPFNVTFLIE